MWNGKTIHSTTLICIRKGILSWCVFVWRRNQNNASFTIFQGDKTFLGKISVPAVD